MKILFDNLKFDNLKIEQVNIFFILSTFLATISYFLIKAFFSNGEFSDNIFVILIPAICEVSLVLILFSNNKYFLKKNSDFFLLGFSFFVISLMWDYNFYNYTKLLNFVFFNLLTLSFFIISNKILINKSFNKNELFALFIFLLIFNGLFFRIDYLSTKNFFIILLINSLYILSFISLKKIGKYGNLIFSLFIFLIFLKVFILSSHKDSFHYSFVLGPSYSSFAGNELLSEVVSQYGYLNILFIKFFSIFTDQRMDYSLVLIITFLFILFFILFLNIVKKTTNYPTAILVLFTATVMFANIGIENLAGSILIPSASVFRFFPALIVMLFMSKIILFKDQNHLKKNIYLFYFFLIIGALWSFESFFFIFFSLLSLLLFFIFFIILKKDKILTDLYTNYKFCFYQFVFLFLIFLFIIFFVFKDNQLIFFYEYIVNGNSIKSVDILNSRYTLLFISFLLINYLFLRSALKIKSLKFFYNNLIWFSLFVSFSAYYVTRSVYNNLFALLPFYIYFILSMKSQFVILEKIKKLFVTAFILMSITSVVLSIYTNKEIFYKKLTSSTFLNIPKYENNSYKPSQELQLVLDNYKGIPVTLVTGKTIHNFNNNLSHGGYGLPILPLEQFNLLPVERKIYLMNIFFKKNNKHLIICLNKCAFYNENTKMKSWDNVFVPLDFKFKKYIINSNDNEILYLFEK